jgi:hypothetical protein
MTGSRRKQKLLSLTVPRKPRKYAGRDAFTEGKEAPPKDVFTKGNSLETLPANE